MSSTLEINGKKLLTIKSAAELTGYSRDYITRLAREKKISATQVGRHWYVDQVSLEHYAEFAKSENQIRKQHLSDERKHERLVKESVESKALARQKIARKLKTRARHTAVATIAFGLLIGFALENASSIPVSLDKQVASAPIVKQFFDTSIESTVTPQIEKDSFVTAFSADITVQTPEFSNDSVRHIATLEGGENGVLLLPRTPIEKETSPEKLFSDEVVVVTDATGAQYVSRVDVKTGETTMIPFVVVPVKSQPKTP